MNNQTATETARWYATYRKGGDKPKQALQHARLSARVAETNNAALAKLSPSSAARIGRFVDSFIRSEYVSNLQDERNRDFFNEPERADRVHEAAKHGADGLTHAEVIQDWRDAFGYWVKDNHRSGNWIDRFEEAVNAHFTSTELWHQLNGSLWQETGF